MSTFLGTTVDRAAAMETILNQLSFGKGIQPNDFEAAVMTASLLRFDNKKKIVVHCPRLSLHTGSDSHHHHHFADRTQAKGHAVQLLSRPMTMVDDDLCNHAMFARIGRTIQQNIFSSFALLVDSRLHAYTDVLTRHAIVLTSMNESTLLQLDPSSVVTKDIDSEEVTTSILNKLLVLNEKKRMIQSKGALTEAHLLTSRFQLPVPQTHSETATSMVVSSPIRYTVTMNLHIPEKHGESDTTLGKNRVVPVSFSTNGCIQCTFSTADVLQSVTIHLDTVHLLEAMIQQATDAVSIIVDVVNQLLCRRSHRHNNNSTRLLLRSVSYLAMPPPMPVVTTAKNVFRNSISDDTSGTTTTNTCGLDLLCSAGTTQTDVPVVSPLMTSNIPCLDHIIAVELTLDTDSSEATSVDDVSRLSLDQCADIVDVCLFGESLHTNHYDLECNAKSFPPPKRIKIEQ